MRCSQPSHPIRRFRQHLRWRWRVAGLLQGGRQRLRQREQQRLSAWLTSMPVLGFHIRPADHSDWRALVEQLLGDAITRTETPDGERRIYVGLQYLDDADDDRATMWVAERGAWWATEIARVLDHLARTPDATVQLTICAHVAVTARVAEHIIAAAR